MKYIKYIKGFFPLSRYSENDSLNQPAAIEDTVKTLLGISFGAVLLSVILGFYWFSQITSDIKSATQQHTERLLDMENSINLAEIAFGKEIQEWKDTLLRGHDAELYNKHQDAFRANHVLMQKALQHAMQAALQLGFSIKSIELLIDQHNQLLQRYDKALPGLDPKKPLSYRVVDEQVRGADRALRRNLDQMRAEIELRVC